MIYKAYQYTDTIDQRYLDCIAACVVPVTVERRTLSHKVLYEDSNIDRIKLIRSLDDVCYLDMDVTILRPLDDLGPGLHMDYVYGSPHGALMVSIGDNSDLIYECVAKHKRTVEYWTNGLLRPGRVFGRCAQIQKIPDEYFTHGFFTTKGNK